MTVINTNTASINAQFNLNKVNQEMEKAMEQLSSGKRINSAARRCGRSKHCNAHGKPSSWFAAGDQ